jgi:hypothetical protein
MTVVFGERLWKEESSSHSAFGPNDAWAVAVFPVSSMVKLSNRIVEAGCKVVINEPSAV